MRYREDPASGERVLTGACARRASAAAWAYRALVAVGREDALIVASGGRFWGAVAEASAMRRALLDEGVPEHRVRRELASLSTSENAARSAALLAPLGIGRAVVVTCAFHLPRALRLFADVGLEVTGFAAPAPPASRIRAGLEGAHEWIATRLEGRR